MEILGDLKLYMDRKALRESYVPQGQLVWSGQEHLLGTLLGKKLV